MAINWTFNPNDVEELFPLIPVGDHRVRIASAEETKSRAQNDMIKLKLDISGYPGSLFYHLVFMPQNTSMTNTNLKRICDSFGIDYGNLNVSSWVGKVGAARIKHEEYNGELRATISYFLASDRQNKLPPWQEKSISPARDFVPLSGGVEIPFAVDDLPL